VGGGRSVDRLINFSDAVVAVAVTVLVLPLVDIAGPEEGQTVWTVIGEHASQVWTFLFTFYVVAVLWLAHNRILNSISRYDPVVFWVNTTWLAAIVLLPWVSAMYGESEWGRSGVGLVYWGTMAAISLLVSALGAHLRRHPELLAADAPRLSAAA
jgi:TMEM175 potassium channel family protein